MPATQADPNELDVVNFVPDEVCVLVSVNAIEDGAAFYEHVRTRLNRQIVALLAVTRRTLTRRRMPRRTRCLADLTPTVLRQRFANDRAPLQPLQRAGVAREGPDGADHQEHDGDDSRESEPARLVPWAVFRRASGTTTRHLYFRLGRDRARLDQMDLERRRLALASVHELCLLLNRSALSTTQEPFLGQAWSIKAAAPNWLTFAAQMACGCPAGLPVALPRSRSRARTHFTFRGPLAKALDAPPRGDVVVAVLDTCPRQVTVDKAANRFANNPLLNSVQRDVRMNAPALLPTPVTGQHLGRCLPRLQWDMQSGPAHDNPDEFQMADHGLFVTGVVYDVLSGRGRVHLIRVLDEFGIGDLFAITQALAVLPRRLLGSDEYVPGEPRLVVNLSLGVDVPIPARLLDRWFPRTSQSLETLRNRLPDVSALLELAHANLADAISALTERGVLVVAATGNDALRQDVAPGDPPPPRFPARYDDVLGVAATRADLQTAADYSNRGETAAAAWPGDVSTFGGNVIPASAHDAPSFTDPSDAIVGIFSSPTLPGGAPNTSGFVHWAGTSFATPIVGAVAARLWATNPTLDPMSVIAWLRTFAHHPHGGADPDGPLEVPVLDVKQS